MSTKNLCEDAGVFRAPAYIFESGDGAFHPTESALSRWGADMLNGPAVVGLAARCLESEHAVAGFQPARFTADLFKAARRVPTTVVTRRVRDGHRVRTAECDVIQSGVPVARATMVQYRRSGPPPGAEWATEHAFAAPAGVSGPVYLIGSDDAGWSETGAEHLNTSRKRVYHRTAEVIAGEPAGPFVRAVIAAEATSLVCNLGTQGIGYINGDLTAALSRLPVGDYIGVQADSHWCADGVSVGSATLFDDLGPLGVGMVTALANPAAQIDFGAAR